MSSPVYFMSLKNPKKIHRTFIHFLVGDGIFCFGVSWLNVSIHQFGGASLGVSYFLVGLLSGLSCAISNALYLFSSVFQSAKCGNFAVIWTLTEFTGLDFLLVFLGFSLVIHKLTAHFYGLLRFWGNRIDILCPLGKCGHF